MALEGLREYYGVLAACAACGGLQLSIKCSDAEVLRPFYVVQVSSQKSEADAQTS